MNDIPPIPATRNGLYALPPRSNGTATLVAETSADVDQLELSDIAQVLARLPADTHIRAEKVARIREAIQDGSYETADKLEYVLERLMDVLDLR